MARTLREDLGFSLWLPPPGEELLFYAEAGGGQANGIAALNSLLVSTVVGGACTLQTRSGKGFSPKRPRPCRGVGRAAACQGDLEKLEQLASFTPKSCTALETIRDVEFVLNLHDLAEDAAGGGGRWVVPERLGVCPSPPH
ncbi:hypothetical protein BASA81_003641 [Batrachochytrium salamandrivorans]|nr:hypothetical protein BASA81_003641 [Batrachochytrium salamandrivorans]